ncbi:hypothetical protein, partial [Amycolatopsis sp. NPDC051372]|uniref:hypothetical protein n=1 Tax=Amycolatopsis sp. NPDC051372 TaxID=3155669 RepID=UPI003445ED6D
ASDTTTTHRGLRHDQPDAPLTRQQRPWSLQLADGAKDVVNDGINIAITAVEGFTGTLREAVDVAEPLARGVGRIASSVAQADGPLGAFREGLELGYDAAKLALNVVEPLADAVEFLAGVFSDLPGPVQTAAVAFLALKVGPSILSGLRSALSGVGKDAEDAGAKTGIFGRAVSTITAPVRAVVSGLSGAVGTVRQFSDEIGVQRGIAEQAGESVGRLAGATAAFNTSAIPAVAAARNFRDQTVAIRDAAAGTGAPISAMGAAIGTVVERSSGLSTIRDSFVTASSGADRFRTAVGLAAAAGTGIKTAASGLVSALGGPWGIALAGAGVALSLLAGHQQDAAQKAAEHKSAVDELSQSLDKQSGAATTATRELVSKNLQDAKAFDQANKLGVSVDSVTDAVLNQGNSYDQLKGKLQGIIKAHTELEQTNSGSNQVMDITAQTADLLLHTLDDQSAKAREAAQKNRELATSMRITEPAAASLTDAVDTLASSTASADDKARALKQAFDTLSGGTIGVANAQAAVDDTIARLNATISQGIDKTQGYGAALLDSSGKLLTTSANGRTLQSTLNDLSSQAATLATSTFEASREAGDDLTTSFGKVADSAYTTRQAFIDAAVQFGLTKEQAGALATQYGLVPSLVATQVTQPGMPAAQAAADILRGKVISVPDSKTVITQALTQDAITKLEALGFKVEHLPDGTIRVTTSGGPAAEAYINDVARNRTSVVTIKYNSQGVPVGAGGKTNIPGLAAGGIMKAFAGGGIEPRPMRGGLASIVPPNTWRIIGDRVRDDEAYIPINRSNRSLALLEETARRMGFDLLRRYATGGIAQSGQVPLSVTSSFGGPFQITGSLDIGGALVPLVDARIQLADHDSGAAFSRGRRP